MRKHYLDSIRWITVVIVVIYHVLYMYNAEGVLGGIGKITNLDVQYYDIFTYLVYPWFMPVLFLVAGISSKLYLDRHTDKEFVKSRTRKLLVPSTIGLFVFQFIQGYINMTIGTAYQDLDISALPKIVTYLIMVIAGQGVLWFIQLLWFFSMVLLLVRKIEKGELLELGSKTPLWLIILFFFPTWGAAQILNTPVIVVYRFAFYFVFYALGYYVFSHEEVIEVLKKYAVFFIMAGVAICVSFAVYYFLIEGGLNYADAPVNRNPFFVASAYFGSLAMLAGMARFGDFNNSFSSWMSKKNFGLYVFHYLGISAVARFIAKPALLPAPACYILSLIAGFAVPYVLYEIISRIPYYRWAVLGIAEDKKKGN